MCSGKILWLVLNSSNSKVGPELCSEFKKHSLFSYELTLPLYIFILKKSVFLPAQSTVYTGSGVWDRWHRNYSLHFTKEETIFPSFQGAGQSHLCGCREEAVGFEQGVVTLNCSSSHVAAHLCYLDWLLCNKAVVLSRRSRRGVSTLQFLSNTPPGNACLRIWATETSTKSVCGCLFDCTLLLMLFNKYFVSLVYKGMHISIICHLGMLGGLQ